MTEVQEYQSIYYEASSRGFFLSISIRPGSLTIIKTRGGNPEVIPLDEANSSLITSELKEIDLSSFNTLVPPSASSAFDAAHMAFIRVSTAQETFESVQFDHGNPPKEIESLVNLILALAKVE